MLGRIERCTDQRPADGRSRVRHRGGQCVRHAEEAVAVRRPGRKCRRRCTPPTPRPPRRRIPARRMFPGLWARRTAPGAGLIARRRRAGRRDVRDRRPSATACIGRLLGRARAAAVDGLARRCGSQRADGSARDRLQPALPTALVKPGRVANCAAHAAPAAVSRRRYRSPSPQRSARARRWRRRCRRGRMSSAVSVSLVWRCRWRGSVRRRCASGVARYRGFGGVGLRSFRCACRALRTRISHPTVTGRRHGRYRWPTRPPPRLTARTRQRVTATTSERSTCRHSAVDALRGQLHTSRPVGMHCIQSTAGVVPNSA